MCHGLAENEQECAFGWFVIGEWTRQHLFQQAIQLSQMWTYCLAVACLLDRLVGLFVCLFVSLFHRYFFAGKFQLISQSWDKWSKQWPPFNLSSQNEGTAMRDRNWGVFNCKAQRHNLRNFLSSDETRLWRSRNESPAAIAVSAHQSILLRVPSAATNTEHWASATQKGHVLAVEWILEFAHWN